MAYKKDIEEDLVQLRSLKNLVDVYGDIASIRMMKIREFVLRNRDFVESINSIFKDALNAYYYKFQKRLEEGKTKKGGKVTFLAHNGKTVAVLISANTGFYGEVVKNTFNKFMEDIKKENVEVSVIGKLGLSLFLNREPNKPYTYFSLPDYGIDQAKLSKVIKHLVQYEEIRVYYGKYISVVTQEPTTFKISAPVEISGKMNIEKPKEQFIFEPSLEKILMFFETQIFASVFDQSLRESQLAKFASRIMAMDAAGQNIEKEISSTNLKKLRVVHRNANKKQLNSLASSLYADVI